MRLASCAGVKGLPSVPLASLSRVILRITCTAQHADEAWISQALKKSPWRVNHLHEADIIYLDGHDFSRWCTASRILAMHNTQWRIDHANETGESACPASPVADSRPAQYAVNVLRRTRRRTAEPVPLFRDEVSKRTLWRQMLMTSASKLMSLPPEDLQAKPIPRVVALTSNECPAPYMPAKHPSEMSPPKLRA